MLCVSTKCDKLKGGDHPVRVFDELEHIMCSSLLKVGLSELRKIVEEQVKCLLKEFDHTKLSRKSKFASSVKKLLRLKKPMRRSETTPSMTPINPAIVVSPSIESTPSSSGSIRSSRSMRASSGSTIRRSASMAAESRVKSPMLTTSRSLHSSRTDIHKIGTLSSATSCNAMNKQVTDIFKKYGYERKSFHAVSPGQSPSMSQMSLRVRNGTSAAWKSLQSSVASILNNN